MGREIQNYTTGKFYSFLVPNLFSALFSVLDTSISNVLTGRLLGDQALAALNSALPVYLLVCTLASGLSCGFFYLASLAYGRAENRKAESLFSLSVEVSLLLSLIVTVLGYILSPAIASLLAAGPLYDMALSYIRTVFLGSVMIIMAYVPFHFLRLEGKVRISAAAVVLMGITNIAGTYIFVYVFGLGVTGAALALVAASTVATLVGFIFLAWTRRKRKFFLAKADFKTLLDSFRYGFPNASDNLFLSLRIIFVNALLSGSDLVTVALVNSVSDFVWCMPNKGVEQTGSPLLGLLAGEKDRQSSKRVLTLEMRTALMLSAIIAVVLFFVSPFISPLFGISTDSTQAMRMLALSLVFSSFTMVVSSWLTAEGRTGEASFCVFSRLLLMPVVFLFIFRQAGIMPWLYLPCGEIATAVIAFIMLRRKENADEDEKVLQKAIRANEDEICAASEELSSWAGDNGLSPHTSMVISLALEEIMTLMRERSLAADEGIFIRLAIYENETILTLRTGGKYYNVLEALDEDSDAYLGIRMIKALASDVDYQSTLGMNSFTVKIRKEEDA